DPGQARRDSSCPSPPLGQPAAAQTLAFVGGQTAPDPVALVGFEGVEQAVVGDLAAGADFLGPPDLDFGRSGLAGGEEKIGGIVGAGGPLAPVGADLEF